MNQHLTSENLVDFIHGELAAPQDALVHAHLAQCSACRALHDSEAALTELLRSSVVAQEREMPSLVSAHVWEQIRAAKPGPLARVAAFLRPAVAIPALAVLLVGGWFASPFSHRHASPTIDVNYYFAAHAAGAGEAPLSERSDPQTLETSMNDGRSTAPLLDAYASYAVPGAPDAVR